MARTEVLNEWFFPLPALKINGLIVPAPGIAVDKYRKLRDGWLENHPKFPKEEPMVSLFPGEKEGQPGYFVRTEIIYVVE